MPTVRTRIHRPGELLLPVRGGAFHPSRTQKTSLALPNRPQDRGCLRGIRRILGHRSQSGPDSMGRLSSLRRVWSARLFDRLDHYARGEAAANQPRTRAGAFPAASARTLALRWGAAPRALGDYIRDSGLCGSAARSAERLRLSDATTLPHSQRLRRR